jgi:alkanesulfonate monooxygenase SsuD/methylene tetrahydromethanopterin reductase-like flavin-dependent oxidoreductase (luciferase family)
VRMQYGAHLPLIDFDGQGWPSRSLTAYAGTARRLGYQWLTVNDHLVFQRPWLDGIVALASVIEASGDMRLATTVALPVVRGAAAVAKAAGALDILSGGRLVLGVGPGSSARDYELVGLPFEERWPRFDQSVRALRAQLSADRPARDAGSELQPGPHGPDGLPIWVASWGSEAGLRRVARLGDGWVASAYNADPAQIAAARATLRTALVDNGRRIDDVPCALATVWTFVTDDERARRARLAELAELLNRPVDQLAGRVLVGTVQHCAEVVSAYAEAGVDRLFIWPLTDVERQLERFMLDVVPAVEQARP